MLREDLTEVEIFKLRPQETGTHLFEDQESIRMKTPKAKDLTIGGLNTPVG